jgi:hypothetical protein
MDSYEKFLGRPNRILSKTPSLEMQKYLRQLEERRGASATWITLTVSHGTIEPEAISELLQLNPTHVTRKGDKVVDRPEIVSEDTYWSLSSFNFVSSTLFDKHLDWMLDQLFGKLPAVRSLQKQGAQMRLNAHMRPWVSVIDPLIDNEKSRQLAQLRIDLQFIIVFQGVEDVEPGY